MDAIFVIHSPILFFPFCLHGNVIGLVFGFVLMPLGQPGGALEGETCDGTLAL